MALLGHLLTSLLPGDKTLEVPRGGRGHPAKRWGPLLPLGPCPTPPPSATVAFPGPLRGGAKAVLSDASCHPLSPGGYF